MTKKKIHIYHNSYLKDERKKQKKKKTRNEKKIVNKICIHTLFYFMFNML